MVAPRPDLVGPVDQIGDFPGYLGIDILHEPSELLGIVDRQQRMEVV